MLKQQLRVLWLRNGDRNIWFFHQAIQRRRSRNSINNLGWNGKSISEPLDIKNAIFSHFKEQFFKRDFEMIFDAKGVLKPKINDEDIMFFKEWYQVRKLT